MKILNKIKLLLLSFFGLSISGNCHCLSPFFILAKSTLGAQGYIYPLFRNNNHTFKLGDATLADNILYKKRATEIVEFFIQENKTSLPENINENNILKHIHNKAKIANIITGPTYTLEMAGVQEYIKNKKEYGNCLSDHNLEKNITEIVSHINNEKKLILIIDMIKGLVITVKIYMLTKNYNEQKKIIENILE